MDRKKVGLAIQEAMNKQGLDRSITSVDYMDLVDDLTEIVDAEVEKAEAMEGRIGRDCYLIRDNKVVKGFIIGVQKEVRLNTGSPDHGRTLPPSYRVLVRFKSTDADQWYDRVYYSKEDLLKDVE